MAVQLFSTVGREENTAIARFSSPLYAASEGSLAVRTGVG